ncbi:hypothetical protein D6833_13555 [Candidatus Parcubacteria bacterium]|nr:MAG: hypothetical protein D6833_13555 [Candidatus Parcubacteria bacterium]
MTAHFSIEKYHAEVLGRPLIEWPPVPSNIAQDILYVLEHSPTTDGLALEPHPVRFMRSGFAFLLRAIVDDEWPALARLLTENPSAALSLYGLRDLPATRLIIRSIAQAGRETGHASNAGAGIIPILGLYYQAQSGALVHATDALHQIMRLSDLSGLPVELLRLPFPAIFLEFGSRTVDDPLVLHGTDGEYHIEGIYLFEYLHPAGSLRDLSKSPEFSQARQVPGIENEPVREITTMVSGSPVGKGRLDDDYLFIFSLYLPESSWMMPLEEAVERQFEYYEAFRRHKDVDYIDKQFFLDLQEAILHAAKILYYMGSKDARVRKDSAQEHLLEKARRRKGAKQQKALVRATRVRNQILVGPESFSELATIPGESSGRSVRPHWRRGHWHTVRFGPNWSKRRLDFFPPVLVRSDAIEKVPNKSRYEID